MHNNLTRGKGMGIKNIKHVLFAVIAFFAMMGLARAEATQPDKFKFSIGSFALSRYDSNISMTDPDLGAGISISPQDTLGIDIESSVLRIEGYYRIRPNHGLVYSWYSIDSKGKKTLERPVEWVDEDGNAIVIPLGVQATSRLETEILKVGYLWSFHHSDKVELGLGAGLHITRLGISLDAATTVPANSSINNVDTSIPLPVVSFVLNYKITPKFHWYLKTEAFALKYDNWTGSFRDTTLGIEYRAWKHFALGAGLNSYSLDLEEDDPKYKLKFDNSTTGALIYLATYF